MLLAAQRLIELGYAERNTRRLLARGAIEVAAWQHPLFVALHASWLIAMLAFIPKFAPAQWWIVATVGVLQAARIWIIASLGPYWTTRIITLPGEPLVRRGPYRSIPHPNYVVVCLELALVPLAFGSWPLALIFTVLNAGLLRVRIRAENEALAYRRTLAS
jgi:methyltransferase